MRQTVMTKQPDSRAGQRGLRGALGTLLAALLATGCASPLTASPDSEQTEEDAEQPQDTATADAQGSDAAGGDTKADAKADSKTGTDTSGGGCKADNECNGLQTTPCQAARCDTDSGKCGVVDLPEGATCTGPADACIASRQCVSGSCQVQFISCEDGNPCTLNSCNSDVGCESADAPLQFCDDGDACTSTSTCQTGACKGTGNVSCDDKNPCTVDTCDKLTGCKNTPSTDGTKCDDGKVCSENDACAAGACVGKAKACPDDGNACTDDSCTEQNKGCLSMPIPLPLLCDDGNPCTTADVCEAGVCKGVAQECNDDNPCTTDACAPGEGCKFTPTSGGEACAATACNAAGTCQAGVCSGKAKSCDDGNVCTDDSCDPKSGCKHSPNTSPCFDGSVCSLDDKCKEGSCMPGSPLPCDDGNVCTDDGCEQFKGCIFKAKPTGTSCGSNLSCVVGVCLDNTCGDGLCSPSETTQSCEADCPETGGECGPTDGQCLGTCRAAKCAVAEDKCTKTEGCLQLGGCIGQCAGDPACEVSCLLGFSDDATVAFLELNQCVAAFCFDDDYWLGKKCTSVGANYLTCVSACESAMCKPLYAQCSASANCTLARDCIKSCNSAPDLVVCLGECKELATMDELLLNADLDDCSAIYCQ